MWALIKNGVVAEVTSLDPGGRFHPALLWQPCAEEVQPGWLYRDGGFSPPAAPAPTWDEIRAERDARIAASEAAWQIETRRHTEQLRLIELGETIELYRSSEWMAAAELEVLRYHQMLRDIPQTYPDPANVVWPEKWMQHDQST